MAYNAVLADRLRKILVKRKGITEKAMFGGLSFLIDGKMFCGVLQNNLVVRIDPNGSEILLKKPHVRPMDFTGRPMKGYLYVSEKGYDTDEKLKEWADLSLKYTSALPRKREKK